MLRSFVFPLCLALPTITACDSGSSTVAKDPNKCTTSKECPEGNTCYGSRCMTHEEMRTRDAEPAAKGPPPSAPPPPSSPPPQGRVPAFDTAAHCESVSQAVGGSFAIKRQCEADEERARKSIATQPVPDRIYDHCEDVGRAVGGAYSIMEQCIKDELASAAQVPGEAPKLGPGKVPGYNIEKYCETVSQAVGGSFSIKRTCEEQESLAKVALSHLEIPKRVYGFCDRTAKAVGGSFEIMKTCVEQELEAMGGG